jgi:uncharacterized membrane-anchored protein
MELLKISNKKKLLLVIVIIAIVFSGFIIRSKIVMERKLAKVKTEIEQLNMNVDTVDQELTKAILKEDKIVLGYVVNNEDNVVARLTFEKDTDKEIQKKVRKKYWDILKQKYPNKRVTVGGGVE